MIYSPEASYLNNHSYVHRMNPTGYFDLNIPEIFITRTMACIKHSICFMHGICSFIYVLRTFVPRADWIV